MKTVTPTTGFCYIQETATGHNLLKFNDVGLTPFDIADELDLIDVADQTALDLIEIYQAPGPNPVASGDIEYDTLQLSADYTGYKSFHRNTTGKALLVCGLMCFTSDAQSPGDFGVGGVAVEVSDEEEVPVDPAYPDEELHYAQPVNVYEISGCMIYNNNLLLPIHVLIPAGMYYCIKLTSLHKFTVGGNDGLSDVQLKMTNILL